MDDLERVARALHAKDLSEEFFDGGPVPSGSAESTWCSHPRVHAGYVSRARAALEALMEPSMEAIEVGNAVSADAGDIWEPSAGISYDGPHCGLEVWQAMIRYILEQDQAGRVKTE